MFWKGIDFREQLSRHPHERIVVYGTNSNSLYGSNQEAKLYISKLLFKFTSLQPNDVGT